ncbi:MAG: sigma-70 family RNA polymerase sigma factor [Armatimonadota bacterium]
MTAQTCEQEEYLVRRVQHGDDGAFDRLVELCAPRVYNLAFRLLGNTEDAQDIGQEAFVRVYQAIPRFKGDAAFSTWLYRIVSNACYDALKRRRRSPVTFTEFADDDNASSPLDMVAAPHTAEDALLQRERQRVVQHAITELPDIFRLVLVLYDLQGLSYQEIAEVTGQPVGTVKSRLNRARNMLREKISEQRELFGIEISQKK